LLGAGGESLLDDTLAGVDDRASGFGPVQGVGDFGWAEVQLGM
jgi:hypothetical protein